MKKNLVVMLIILVLMFVCGCRVGGPNEPEGNPNINHPQDENNITNKENDDKEEQNETPFDPIEVPSDIETPGENDETLYAMTIDLAGTYELTGTINGVIYINAPDSDVELVLDNATIISNKNSPIYCESANELKIKLNSGSENYIYDNRESIDEENEDSKMGKGAIYSKADLKFTGKGSLYINASYNNGIHCTDDIKFKNTSSNGSLVKVIAYNHAVKGNDSIEIESGCFQLASKCGSGLKTENTDISSKGNQRGTIKISGGDFEICSCEDAIEAAYNVEIENEPSFKILTSKYSSYTLGSISSDTNTTSNTMYLRTSNNTYNYSVLFKNNNGVETLIDSVFDSSQSGGKGGSYYFYKLNVPADAVTMKVYKYDKTTTTRTTTNAIENTKTFVNINTNYDTCVLQTSFSFQIQSWTSKSLINGPGGHGGMQGPNQESNTNKADYSAKGIKSGNDIIIENGIFDIKTYDDAIHANFGNELENGSISTGKVTINGGNFTLYSTDDAIHSDTYLTINGGTINIVSSYEGLEGNVITINDGNITIYSTDDGINASNKANIQPSIVINGGIVDITVYGNDVDGIDSNNTYTQNGGIVITKGGNGGMSTGLDTDSTCKVIGGSLIVFGKPEKAPSLGSGVRSYTLQANYSVGSYKISNTEIDLIVSTKYSYNVVYVYSDDANNFVISKE